MVMLSKKTLPLFFMLGFYLESKNKSHKMFEFYSSLQLQQLAFGFSFIQTPTINHRFISICASANHLFGQKERALHDYIAHPPIPKLIPQQTLLEWTTASTLDYQLLDYAPDVTFAIAFMRLLGVSQISMADLTRERGSKKCYINRLDLTENNSKPQLLTCPDDVLDSLSEFTHPSIKIKSLDRNITNPLFHIKPALMKNINANMSTDQSSNRLQAFYLTMSRTTDAELQTFCKIFLDKGKDNEQNQQLLYEKLKKARALCAAHVANVTEKSMPTSSPR